MKNITIALAAAVLSLSAAVSLAHDYKLGALEIGHPYARATPPNAPVSGGYLTIRNTGDEADRLIGGEAGFADRVEIESNARLRHAVAQKASANELLTATIDTLVGHAPLTLPLSATARDASIEPFQARRTRWPRTSSGPRCTPWTSSVPFGRSGTRGSARKRSPRASSSRWPPSGSA